MTHSFDPAADDPAIRQKAAGDDDELHVFGYPCPFCGDEQLKLSYSDVPIDRHRVELYCNNPRCEVREFVVLALRAGTASHGRTDILALDLIDERPIDKIRREERERTGEIKFYRAHHAPQSSPEAVLARRTGGVSVEVHHPHHE